MSVLERVRGLGGEAGVLDLASLNYNQGLFTLVDDLWSDDLSGEFVAK